jgi:acyl-coenzyme A synthetase/AMP-(fatty) acid ligase
VTLFPFDAFPADRPAALDDLGRVLSYRDLAQISVRLASSVPARTVALVLVRNTLGCVAAIVALIKQGAVPILLDARAAQATIALHRQRYQPDVLVLPSDLQAQYPDNPCLLIMLDYAVLASEKHANCYPPHPDLALLLSTSGSTGSPKLVRQSRGNVLSNAQAIASYLNIGSSDRPVTSLPLHYTYGFSVLSSHLQVGATLLVTDRSVMEKPFWTFFKEAGATSLAGVPYTYQMLKRLGFHRLNSGALRTLTQAGGKLSDALVREFAEFAARSGIDFYVMYGQAEATARMSYVPPARALEKAGSIGVAIPGGELFLVDPTGCEITATYVQGELGYRGPNVTMGYAEHRADLSKGDERQGNLLTGDLALRDADGYYYITGRLSRIAKLFGKRVSLDDLEQICLGLVAEVACTSAEDRVTVWITDGQQHAALPGLLAVRTAIHQSAFQVRVIDSLPRTPAGKTDYQWLLNEVLA